VPCCVKVAVVYNMGEENSNVKVWVEIVSTSSLKLGYHGRMERNAYSIIAVVRLVTLVAYYTVPDLATAHRVLNAHILTLPFVKCRNCITKLERVSSEKTHTTPSP
jgi:hypothetical protein